MGLGQRDVPPVQATLSMVTALQADNPLAAAADVEASEEATTAAAARCRAREEEVMRHRAALAAETAEMENARREATAAREGLTESVAALTEVRERVGGWRGM
jgi:hypothetical protein